MSGSIERRHAAPAPRATGISPPARRKVAEYDYRDAARPPGRHHRGNGPEEWDAVSASAVQITGAGQIDALLDAASKPPQSVISIADGIAHGMPEEPPGWLPG